MQEWQKSKRSVQHVGVLLFDGFSNHCLANAVEPMRAANMLSRKTLYTWEHLTIDGQPAQSSSGLRIMPQQRLSDASGEMLMVMPSYGYRDLASVPVRRGLRAAARRFDRLAGLDTGSWLMAQAGLLDHRRATIHWDVLTAFAETFEDIDVQQDRFVIDDDRITCSGAMAAFDLVLHLVEADHGAALALQVAQLFMSRGATDQGATLAKSKLLRDAIALMQTRVETPLRLSQVARQVGCTQKKLEQVMRRELGATPAHVYRSLRLNEARRLAEDTDISLAEVALRCGYASPSAMTRAFRATFGLTPMAVRQGGGFVAGG